MKSLNCVVYEYILIKRVTKEVKRMLTIININRVFTQSLMLILSHFIEVVKTLFLNKIFMICSAFTHVFLIKAVTLTVLFIFLLLSTSICINIQCIHIWIFKLCILKESRYLCYTMLFSETSKLYCLWAHLD